jgi:hypothetical protein
MNQEDHAKIKRLNEQYQASIKRIESYKNLYDEKMADKLGRAFAEYSWVAPEVLIPIVLSGQEAALPEISKISARQSMEIGLTPHMLTDQYQKNKVHKVGIAW